MIKPIPVKFSLSMCDMYMKETTKHHLLNLIVS